MNQVERSYQPLVERILSSGWACLDQLAEKDGASFYLADPDLFESNCRAMLSAFRSLYPRTSLGYSYKTNYLPAFALRAQDIGLYAEVVSRDEFEYALQLQVPASRILFNGPVKGPEDLRRAFQTGARVNVDSLDELRRVKDLSGRSGGGLRIGLRCFLGHEDTRYSRFGIDIESDEARIAVQELAGNGVIVSGLHVHHSGDRNPDRYRDRTRSLIRIHEEVFGGMPLEFIDVGGGFMSKLSPDLASQLGLAQASYEDYAAAIAPLMKDAYGDDGPELILEPGMAVLADTMAFVTRVHAVKRLGGRTVAVVDGSIFNVKPLRGAANPTAHVVAAPAAGRSSGPVDFVGHTCMEIDILHKGFNGAVGIGDYLVVENMGAYTNVLNAPFIRGTPAILDFRDNHVGTVLRPASTLAQLAASYGLT